MQGRNRGQRSSTTRGRSLQIFVIALVFVATLGLVVLNLPRRSVASRADPSDASLVPQGQQVYLARCASCHGANLEGQPNWQQELPGGGRPAPPHDASGHTWGISTDEILTRSSRLPFFGPAEHHVTV